MNIPQVAKATGLSIGKTTEAIRVLRQDRRIANVGSEDFPQWTLRIGDDTSTKELHAEVSRLIHERPMTMQELVDFTGARMSRISGVLVQIQRSEGQRVLNLGSARRARWLLLSENTKVANLTPKSGPIPL